MWKTYKLSEIGTVVGGATPSTSVSSYYGGDIPWLTPKDLSNFQDRYIEKGERNITQEGLDSCSAQLLPANTVLFSSRAPIGYVAIAKNPIATNQGFKSIIPNEKVDSLFLYYILKYNKDRIEAMGSGTTFKEVSGAVMKNVEISLPGLEEQRRIAGILGAIDDKIENNRRINENLEQQAQALYKQWFVDNRSDDWKEIKLSDILEIHKKTITPSQTPNTIFEHYSLPAFDDGRNPTYESGDKIKSSKFVIEDDMFLFSKLNPRIKRLWLPYIQTENAICSTEFVAYKPKDISMLAFCYSVVDSVEFYDFVLSLTNGSTGSHQRFHPIDTLEYSLKVPHMEVIKEFNAIVSHMYEQISKNIIENRNLATLRDTLLPKMMNGELNIDGVR